MRTDVCDVKHAKHLDSNWRRWVQNPEKILNGLLKPGQTAMDIGCGTGLFAVQMAEMVGDTGKVIAIDLQQGMLDLAREKADSYGVTSRMIFHCCEQDSLGVKEKADLILAFYMVHEVPDKKRFFKEVVTLLKDVGIFFLVEPKIFHVSKQDYLYTISLARECGLEEAGTRKIVLSRSTLFRKAA